MPSWSASLNIGGGGGGSSEPEPAPAPSPAPADPNRYYTQAPAYVAPATQISMPAMSQKATKVALPPMAQKTTIIKMPAFLNSDKKTSIQIPTWGTTPGGATTPGAPPVPGGTQSAMDWIKSNAVWIGLGLVVMAVGGYALTRKMARPNAGKSWWIITKKRGRVISYAGPGKKSVVHGYVNLFRKEQKQRCGFTYSALYAVQPPRPGSRVR